MKKALLSLSLLLLVSSLIAQTQISGVVTGSLSLANSPYQVIDNIDIPSGQTLTIEPGVEVVFQGHYQLQVHGKLMANGTETDSIYFTTNNPTVGWGGIRVNSSETCELAFCRIEYGKTELNYPDNVGGGLGIFDSNAFISNCVFADNMANGDDDGLGGAIYAINTGNNGVTRIEKTTFLRNYAYGEGGAIKLSGDFNTEIDECTFLENNARYGGGALAFYASSNATIRRSLFANNYTLYSNGGAVVTLGFGNTLSFENCTFFQNSANNGEGGAINLAYATVDFVNTIIFDNPGQYGDDLNLSQNGEASLNYCNATIPDAATGTNNITTDPLFVDESNQDFHLQEDSPCIDAGTDIALPYMGDAPDIGCYEYVVVSHTSLAQKVNCTFLPNPTHDMLSITSNQTFDNVQLTATNGQLVWSQDLDPTNAYLLHINQKHIAPGIYFIRLSTHNHPITIQKVVVE